ncbi:DUF6271 family protein [Clostridium cellulovorans]|uniref:DUF6271 family protein n=1 Tax=Clostridium cellulovorans TaxID=1493 RepID=UPI001F618CB3|nr:DUF6271 family protein [Clostridium cellulovorans]
MSKVSVFAIPTNRIIDTAVISASNEIYAAKEYINEDIKLVIVDNSTSSILEHNTKFLKDFSNISHMKIMHLTLENQIKIIKEISIISGVELDELMDLLLPKGCDYGRISNMIYLIVTMLGSDVFFRRDSDCNVRKIPKDQYPILQEVKYLGKKINTVKKHLSNSIIADSFGKEEILVVGGDYFGEWNLDVKDLKDRDENIIRNLVKLNDIEEALIDDYIEVKYSEMINKNAEKPVLISVYNQKGPNKFLSKEIHRYPECGNISMKDVFKWIPSFVGLNGIAFDYNTQQLSSFLKVPILYHCNKINHDYDNGRKEIEALKPYWKGIIKQNDLSLLTTKFSHKLFDKLSFNNKISNFNQMKKLANKDIPDFFEESFYSISTKERIDRIDALINDVLLSSKIDKYKVIAEYLSENKFDILDELNNDYHKSVKLHRLWPKIMEASTYVLKKGMLLK